MKTILCSRGQTHAGSCSNPAQKWTKAIHSTKARKNGVDWILIFSIALAKDEQGRISPLINRLSQRIPYFTRWQNKMQSRVDHAPHRNADALALLPTFLRKKNAKICCMNDSERSRPAEFGGISCEDGRSARIGTFSRCCEHFRCICSSACYVKLQEL